MSSEWLKVMLEEIARRKTEDEQARAEEQRRSEERDALGPIARADDSAQG